MTTLEFPDWLTGTTRKDWLRDGYTITEEQWAALDWSRAWIDMGPSPAVITVTGNYGDSALNCNCGDSALNCSIRPHARHRRLSALSP